MEILEGSYYSSKNSVKGGYLDFNPIFENDSNVVNDISENPTEAANNRNSSEISEDMRHVTPSQPQNFEENPEAESSEDELIRTYISIDRSKSADPENFEESQNSPYAKQWMEAMQKEIKDLAA